MTLTVAWVLPLDMWCWVVWGWWVFAVAVGLASSRVVTGTVMVMRRMFVRAHVYSVAVVR